MGPVEFKSALKYCTLRGYKFGIITYTQALNVNMNIHFHIQFEVQRMFMRAEHTRTILDAYPSSLRPNGERMQMTNIINTYSVVCNHPLLRAFRPAASVISYEYIFAHTEHAHMTTQTLPNRSRPSSSSHNPLRNPDQTTLYSGRPWDCGTTTTTARREHFPETLGSSSSSSK